MNRNTVSENVRSKSVGSVAQSKLNSRLCTGCGTCAAVCPNRAIRITLDEQKGCYTPKILTQKCNNCGLCNEICPAYTVDLINLSSEIFGQTCQNHLIGSFRACYIGHSNDLQIRKCSSSGGLVTQLLIFALEKGVIDGALVTRMCEDNPLRTESFIARTEAEIISSAGSKYCPAPVNSALTEILDTPGKYAIVGLPCHIEAARKTEKLNKTLRDRIVLHLGLVCNHTPTFLATEYLLGKLGIPKDQVKKIDYRTGKGDFGRLKIVLRNGHNITVPHNDILYWGSIFQSFFYPWRCLFCEDKMCRLSDIAFMDAWLPRYSKEKKGLSLVVSRSQIGQEILRNASLAGKVRLDFVSVQEIVEAQKLILFGKRALSRVSLLKSLRIRVPTFDCSLSRAGFIDYLKAMSQFLSVYVSENRATWFLLDRYLQILRLVHPDHVDKPHVEVD